MVEADSSEGALPAEWRLLWVAEGLPNLVILPDTTFAAPILAQAVSVLPPTAAETSANQITCHFRSAGALATATARWILDLPAGSSGKFVVYALLPGLGGASETLARSPTVCFNGGTLHDLPPLVMNATGDHTTTRLQVRGVGVGLGAATAASLVAADTSWRVQLVITEATDSTLTAEAEIPTQLPDAIVQVSLAERLSATTPLAASQVTAPTMAPITIRGNSWLVPLDSAGVTPKDFAFIYNTVATETPGVWRGLFHLIYIRRLPGDTTLSLGHAWSPDLSNWSFDPYAFRTGPIGSWDAQNVWAPSIVQNGNLFYMFYTGRDAGGNQRIGRVTTPLLDTTNTVWSVDDRKLVYAADSTDWVVRHPPRFLGADQFRDPFVFPDPDSTGRFLMVYTALDTNYKAQDGHSVGLARNRPGTLDRWLDLGRYAFTDYGHNGQRAQVESPHVIPDSGYVPPYWITGSHPTGWRLLYTWGGNHPPGEEILRMAKDTSAVNVADITAAGWGASLSLYDYLSADASIRGLQASEHLKAGNVDYIAGYNAYEVDGIQISRMYWNGPHFLLRVPDVTGIDRAGSATANVRLSVLRFDPGARKLRFRIGVPAALPVRLDVYDVAGRRLRKLLDQPLPAGDTIVEWDLANAAGIAVRSGVYFARLSYASGSRVARIPIIR